MDKVPRKKITSIRHIPSSQPKRINRSYKLFPSSFLSWRGHGQIYLYL